MTCSARMRSLARLRLCAFCSLLRGLPRQRLLRRAAFGVKLGDTLKAAVTQELGVRVQKECATALLQYLEVVLPPLAVVACKDKLAVLLHEDLAFMGVPFFLA